LRVEIPEGKWEVYDVVPEAVHSPVVTHLKPVVEFDEKQVRWYTAADATEALERRTHLSSAKQGERSLPSH
jgi:hypothetical protein